MLHGPARLARNVGATAVFGGLSFLLDALTAPYLPRVPAWGMGIIDPVSIIWITSYLLFGLMVGFTTSVIGTIGLIFFDPFTPVGPIMKFLATIPIILALDLGLRLGHVKPYSGGSLKSLRRFIPLCLIGVIVRIIILTFMNILLFMTILNLNYATISLFGFHLASWNAVVIVAILVNAEQSVWDCGGSYLLTFSTRLYDQFEFW